MKIFNSIKEIEAINDEVLKNIFKDAFNNFYENLDTEDAIEDINLNNLRDYCDIQLVEIETISDFKDVRNFDINSSTLEVIEDEMGNDNWGNKNESHIGYSILDFILSDDGSGAFMVINHKKGIDRSIIDLIKTNQEYLMNDKPIPKENLI